MLEEESIILFHRHIIEIKLFTRKTVIRKNSAARRRERTQEKPIAALPVTKQRKIISTILFLHDFVTITTFLTVVSSGRAFRPASIVVDHLRHISANSIRQQTQPQSAFRYNTPYIFSGRPYSSSACLSMKNKKGKTIAKENLPSKVCVVCNRPFTWRKKWERNWDEVTTCSKSCNAKRKAMAKTQPEVHIGDDDNLSVGTITSGTSSGSQSPEILDKKALRKQHKEAVKAQKRERRLKRMGKADSDVGRKACDLCGKRVDLLIRCTVDETQQFKMVCGKCWPSVSGGVPDGIPQTHPHYRYGGLWKNRNADLKKRVGSGGGNKKKTTGGNNNKKPTLLEEIEQSVALLDVEDESESGEP